MIKKPRINSRFFYQFTLESISRIRIETVEVSKNSRSPLSFSKNKKGMSFDFRRLSQVFEFEDPEIQRPK